MSLKYPETWTLSERLPTVAQIKTEVAKRGMEIMTLFGRNIILSFALKLSDSIISYIRDKWSSCAGQEVCKEVCEILS